MTDSRRLGDNRPIRRDRSVRLLWWPVRNMPFRWLPRHGEPLCIAEWVSQTFVKIVAWLPVYTAIIITLVFLVEIFGVPFVGRK